MNISLYSQPSCRASLISPPANHTSSPSRQPPTSISAIPNRSASYASSSSVPTSLQCPHFHVCSGCTHEYYLHRPAVVDEAAEFFKNFGVPDFTFDSGNLWGWRCRAKLAVRGSSSEPLLGLYQEGTHRVVDIPDCKAHHPNINAAVELLKKGIAQLNVEPYDEDAGMGELRYLQVAVTTYNTSIPQSQRYKHGNVQVTLVWNSRSESSPSFQKLEALAHFLWRNGGPKCDFHLIHSVWANFQTSKNNIIFGSKWKHLFGERDFWEHIGGIDASLNPSSFGQANTMAFNSLLRKLQKYVPYGSTIADLYGGAGIIGLSLAATRKCRSVKCIEINKESKSSFERTLSRLPRNVDSNISWHHADASVDPLSWLLGSDVVVVDPPRKGLDESVIGVLLSMSLAKNEIEGLNSLPYSATPGCPSIEINKLWCRTVSKVKDEKRPWVLRAREASLYVQSETVFGDSHLLPQTLIYISCRWDSFKKDCKTLLSTNNWYLDKAHGFNFFPGTPSIEVLAVFRRGARATTLKKNKSAKKKKKLM